MILNSMFETILEQVLIDEARCENFHTQTSHIVNANKYKFLQVQLWSNPTTKINDPVINALPTQILNIDKTIYKLHSVRLGY